MDRLHGEPEVRQPVGERVALRHLALHRPTAHQQRVRVHGRGFNEAWQVGYAVLPIGIHRNHSIETHRLRPIEAARQGVPLAAILCVGHYLHTTFILAQDVRCAVRRAVVDDDHSGTRCQHLVDHTADGATIIIGRDNDRKGLDHPSTSSSSRLILAKSVPTASVMTHEAATPPSSGREMASGKVTSVA